MSNTTSKTNRLVITAVLAALTFAISFLPIKTLGLEITLAIVPVAVGATVFGPKTGLILGTVFGLASLAQCIFGWSAFGATMLQINWFWTVIVCVPTRALAGWLTGIIYRTKRNNISLFAACLCSALLNTLFFMSVLCAAFYTSDYIQGFVSALGASNVFAFVLLFVGINGLVEILLSCVVAFPCAKAVKKYIN